MSFLSISYISTFSFSVLGRRIARISNSLRSLRECIATVYTSNREGASPILYVCVNIVSDRDDYRDDDRDDGRDDDGRDDNGRGDDGRDDDGSDDRNNNGDNK